MVKRKQGENDPISVLSMANYMRFHHANYADGRDKSVIFDVLFRYALNRIEWVGLPSHVSPVVLEQLMLEGQVPALYKPDWAPEPILLTATGVGNMDNQRLHSRYNLRALNQRQTMTNIPRKKIALLDPRHLRLDVWRIIEHYSEWFEEFNRSLRSNLRVQKTPVRIIGPQSQRLTMINEAKAIEDGDEFIYEYNDRKAAPGAHNDIQALTFNVHYVGGDILVDRRAMWNDVMTWLGIDNVNQDKRERLVTDEVAGNSQQIEFSRFIELQPRRDFAEDANAKFGLTIDAFWRHDFQTNNRIMALDDTVEDSADITGTPNGGLNNG